MKRLLAVALTSLFTAVVHAAPVTIDFEEFNVVHNAGNFYQSIQSKGFDISGGVFDAAYYPDPASIVNGNSGSKSFGGSVTSVGLDSFGARVIMDLKRSDGGAFALYDVDFFAEFDLEGYSYITGTKVGGGVVTLGDAALGTGDWLNLQSVAFGVWGDGFSFGYATGEIDNIVVSAVPIPAAVWLFGSALAGMGWFRRKRTV